MAKIRVLVNGAQGRMGQAVLQAMQGASDLQLVAACDRGDDLAAALRKSHAQVAVDFTHPDCALANAKAILHAKVRPVIGTTGFSMGEIRSLQALAAKKRLGGIVAPNFAIGVVLMNAFAAMAVKHLPDVEIVELHHNRKADAPSGTATQTAQLIQQAATKTLNRQLVREHEAAKGARGGKLGEIRVHSVRLPGFLAHQEILFGGPGQVLTIRHDAMSREAYMPGVLLAIRRAPALKTLLYGLENLL